MGLSEAMVKVGRAARQGASLIRSGRVSQAAALCYREENGEQIFLLISGRKGRRLGIPKGNVDPGELSPAAAAREAYEEAGVVGRAEDRVLTSYSYRKDGRRFLRQVVVHPLRVAALEECFPEKGERRLSWMRASEAAVQVAEPSLKSLFQQIATDPRWCHREHLTR